MKYLSILLILFSYQALSESLTNDSYRGVKIGTKASEAIKILKSLKSTADPQEPNASCYYLESSDKQTTGLSFMVDKGAISRIDVYENKSISTAQGIHIGSTKEDVLKKYKKVEASPHPYLGSAGEYLEVRLTETLGIIFETANDIVTSFRLGDDSIYFIEGCS